MFKRFSLILICFVISASTHAQSSPSSCRAVVQAAVGKAYALELGQHLDLEIRSPGSQTGPGVKTSRAVCLGRCVSLDHRDVGAFFFDATAMRIHYFPAEAIEIISQADESVIPLTKLAPVIRSVNQEGGTCAAYAIYNGTRQLFAQGFLGNGMIANHMADEVSRGRYLVRVAMDYYGDDSHLGTESNIAKELGFEVSSLSVNSPIVLAELIRESSSRGWPMLIRFDVGKPMSETPYTVFDHANQVESTRRLWLPRPPHGNSSGGHQIMVLKTFVDPTGQEWMLVVDSNWQAPRLWKIQELNSVSSANIRGWTLWQKGPNPGELPPPPNTPFLWDKDDLAGSGSQSKPGFPLVEPPEL